MTDRELIEEVRKWGNRTCEGDLFYLCDRLESSLAREAKLVEALESCASPYNKRSKMKCAQEALAAHKESLK